MMEGELHLSVAQNSLFYSSIQVRHRDVSTSIVHCISQQCKNTPLKILDLFCSSGVRGLRYCKAVVSASLVGVDSSPNCIETARKNAKLNNIDDTCFVIDDVTEFLLRAAGRTDTYDIIELDPYGSSLPYISLALPCLSNGGLICATFTDADTLSGKDMSKTSEKYGVQFHRATASNYSLNSVGNFKSILLPHDIQLRIALTAVLRCIRDYSDRETATGRVGAPLACWTFTHGCRVIIQVQQVSNICVTAPATSTAFPVCQAFDNTDTSHLIPGKIPMFTSPLHYVMGKVIYHPGHMLFQASLLSEENTYTSSLSQMLMEDIHGSTDSHRDSVIEISELYLGPCSLAYVVQQALSMLQPAGVSANVQLPIRQTSVASACHKYQNSRVVMIVLEQLLRESSVHMADEDSITCEENKEDHPVAASDRTSSIVCPVKERVSIHGWCIFHIKTLLSALSAAYYRMAGVKVIPMKNVMLGACINRLKHCDDAADMAYRTASLLTDSGYLKISSYKSLCRVVSSDPLLQQYLRPNMDKDTDSAVFKGNCIHVSGIKKVLGHLHGSKLLVDKLRVNDGMNSSLCQWPSGGSIRNDTTGNKRLKTDKDPIKWDSSVSDNDASNVHNTSLGATPDPCHFLKLDAFQLIEYLVSCVERRKKCNTTFESDVTDDMPTIISLAVGVLVPDAFLAPLKQQCEDDEAQRHGISKTTAAQDSNCFKTAVQACSRQEIPKEAAAVALTAAEKLCEEETDGPIKVDHSQAFNNVLVLMKKLIYVGTQSRYVHKGKLMEVNLHYELFSEKRDISDVFAGIRLLNRQPSTNPTTSRPSPDCNTSSISTICGSDNKLRKPKKIHVCFCFCKDGYIAKLCRLPTNTIILGGIGPHVFDEGKYEGSTMGNTNDGPENRDSTGSTVQGAGRSACIALVSAMAEFEVACTTAYLYNLQFYRTSHIPCVGVQQIDTKAGKGTKAYTRTKGTTSVTTADRKVQFFRVHSSTGNLTIHSCTLCTRTTSQPVVGSCIISTGVVCLGQATLIMRNSSVCSKPFGCSATADGDGKIGIGVYGGSKSHISFIDTHISHCSAGGIVVSGGVKLWLSGCSVTHCKSGIYASNHCTIRCGTLGIDTNSEGNSGVSSNTTCPHRLESACQLSNHRRCGLEAFGESVVELAGCYVSHNAGGGILISGLGSSVNLSLQCMVVCNQLANVTISDSAVCHLVDHSCMLSHGAASGVFVNGQHSVLSLPVALLSSMSCLDGGLGQQPVTSAQVVECGIHSNALYDVECDGHFTDDARMQRNLIDHRVVFE